MTQSQLLLVIVLCWEVCLTASVIRAEPRTTRQLCEMANSGDAELARAIESTFDKKELTAGTAWSGHGAEFFFAVRTAHRPKLLIDGLAGSPMRRLNHSDLWYSTARIKRLGSAHYFYYQIEGKQMGGVEGIPAFTSLSYLMPGIKSGWLSEKRTVVSHIYDSMQMDYWVYLPAGYDAKTPAALMVFQDGEGYTRRDQGSQALNVIDNLIARKQIPYMVCVFVNPGKIAREPRTSMYDAIKAYSDRWQRSVEDSTRSMLYDTVSDRYARFLVAELLPVIESNYAIRADAYSRAITGLSSGGICAFNAAWQKPDQFSRVMTWIGSFTSIQWKESAETADGGQDYPEKVLREEHRNLRVWMQDGSNDLEWNQFGSWPMANIRMANALKLKEYDFHFSFGRGGHNTAQGEAQFPEAMRWLWREYDTAKTTQNYEMETQEKAKELFRVTISNRDSD